MLNLQSTARLSMPAFDARTVSRGFVAAMAMAFAMASSWGANANVTVEVTAVPTTVSLSRTDLKNFGAVAVTVTPTQNNVINGLVFTSRAKVVVDDTTVPPTTTSAKFKESIPAAACVENTAGDAVTCSVAQARLGDQFNYVLIYESPAAGLRMQYDWEFTYSQAGSPGSASSNINSSGQALATLTEVNSPQQRKKLNTFVLPVGGALFTGIGSAFAPTTTDPIGDLSTTTLNIPNGLGLKNAVQIEEDDGVPGGQSNDTLTTNTTAISIPSTGFFATPITIVLQRDESTIRSRTQNAANRVPLYYTADTGELWQPGLKYPLKNCADIGGAPTATDAVCVDQRIYVKNNMLGAAKPGGGFYSSLDLNDFVFVLKALQNGKTSW